MKIADRNEKEKKANPFFNVIFMHYFGSSDDIDNSLLTLFQAHAIFCDVFFHFFFPHSTI